MSWRDQYRKASFRGVPFFVDDAERSVGRRLAVHGYPLRDKPYPEDMGRAQRTFNISGFVLGADYISQTDALENACEAPGKALLVHPSKGSIDVVCRGATIRESRLDGGIAYFEMEFMEAGLQQYPAAAANPLDKITAASGGLISAARANFLSSITVLGVPSFVPEAFQSSVSDIGNLMQSIQAGGITSALLDQGGINQIASLGGLIGQLQSAALSFIGVPTNVADVLQSAFSLFGTLAPSPQTAVANYEAARTGFSVQSRTEYTDLVVLENRNRTATKRFNDVLAVANEALYVPVVEYGSYESAIAARQAFIAKVDALSNTDDDAEFTALQSIKTEVAGAVPGQESDLPHIESLTLKKRMPALAVAYDLYEDATRDAEIAERNHQRHPGFLEAGKPLEVLSA